MLDAEGDADIWMTTTAHPVRFCSGKFKMEGIDWLQSETLACIFLFIFFLWREERKLIFLRMAYIGIKLLCFVFGTKR